VRVVRGALGMERPRAMQWFLGAFAHRLREIGAKD